MGLPSVQDREDPANKLLAVGAIIGLLVLTTCIVFLQLHLRALNSVTVESAPAHLRDIEQLTEPGLDRLSIVGKQIVMAHTAAKFYKANDAEDLKDGIDELNHIAVTRVDRVRAATLMGELKGKIEAINRLEKLEAEIVDPSLKADVGWLLKIYRSGVSGLDQAARTSLVDRHGWFGHVALVYDKSELDPDRLDVLAGVDSNAVLVATLTSWFQGLSHLIGLSLAVMAIIKIRSGELVSNFDAPAVGGPVYLEMVVAFFVLFAFNQLLMIPAITAGGSVGVVWFFVSEILLWGCFAAVIWPRLRGVPRDALMLDLGLHTGQGWAPEIKAGFIGFMAALPLGQLGGLIGRGIESLFGASSETTLRGFPMFEIPVNNSWAVMIMGAATAVIWAPFLEEIVLRGALYQAVRPWARWLGAALITAFFFGIIHPYGLDGILSVAFGGFAYAIIREWRGSLIACIVAHMLHNGTIQIIQFATLTALAN